MAPPAARLSAAPPGACKCRAGPSSAYGHASVPPFTCEEHRTFCLSPAARRPSRHMPASAMQPHFPPAAGHLRPHVPCEYHASSFLTYGASAPSCAACAACRTSFFSLSGKCSPGALGRQCRLRFVLHMSHIRAFCLRRGICAPMYPANITHLHFSPAVHLHHRSPAKNTTRFSPAAHLRRPAPPVQHAG